MGEDVRPLTNISEHKMCSKDKCIDDNDNRSLQCHICKRKVHYECTLLPPYQLQLHRYSMLGKSFSTYVCANCVEVPESLKNSDLRNQNSLKEKYDQEVEKTAALTKEVSNLTQRIERLEKELSKTKNDPYKNDTNHEMGKSQQKKRRLESKAEDLQQDNSNAMFNSIIQHLNKTLTQRLDSMYETLAKTVDEKCKFYSNTKDTKTYASITNDDKLRNDIAQKGLQRQQSKNTFNEEDQLSSMEDKKERDNNIIIHGKSEEKHEEDDPIFVEKFMKTVTGKEISLKTFERIGRYECNKKRPIKIVLQTLEDKRNIMRNLRRLKDKEEYQQISVREDYTFKERQMIKEMIKKANERNEKEPDDSKNIWRVYGTPTKGMGIRQTLKRSTPVKC